MAAVSSFFSRFGGGALHARLPQLFDAPTPPPWMLVPTGRGESGEDRRDQVGPTFRAEESEGHGAAVTAGGCARKEAPRFRLRASYPFGRWIQQVVPRSSPTYPCSSLNDTYLFR